MTTITVTPLEKQVLEAMAKNMYAEPGFSDVGIEEISKETGLSSKVIRGVGSSLVKKNLIDIDTRDDEYPNQPNMNIWYLGDEVMGLAEAWVGLENYKGGVIEECQLETETVRVS